LGLSGSRRASPPTDRRRGLSSTPAFLLGANDAATRLADRNDRPGARRGGDAGRTQGSRVGAALARRYIAGARPEAALTRAARLNDEVEEIAEPGPMRLFLCDAALERARLAFARLEVFAPLNGLVDDGPPKPALPDAAEAARLDEEARTNLATSRKLIADCGYHRRDEELTELEDVAAGRRRFADLPPRV
jgi:hypothetical protein